MKDDQAAARLHQLADFLEETNFQLSQTQHYLRYIDDYGSGFSVLGLICEAYKTFTQDGEWRRSQRAPEAPYFLCGGEMEDKCLPTSVVAYFGLRNRTGSFEIEDLPQQVKNMMRTPRRGSYSLFEVGRDHWKTGKRIAAQIIRATPRSLLESYAPPPEVVPKETPQSPLNIDPKTGNAPPTSGELNIRSRRPKDEN